MASLSGRTAIVTGTSRRVGIGSAIAHTLAEEGANVCLAYWSAYDRRMPWGVDPLEIRELESYVRSCGVGCFAIEADLALTDTPLLLFDAATHRLGHVDILVNNAAMNISQELHQLTSEAIDEVYRVNVRGTMLLTAEFVRRHDGRPGGRVINLTSGQGDAAMPTEIPYAVSKGAVEAFTRSVSVALARKDITVNAIDPGATDTGWMTPSLLADLERAHVRGRVGQPQDAANIVAFLVSDRGAWVSGQIIRSRGAV